MKIIFFIFLKFLFILFKFLFFFNLIFIHLSLPFSKFFSEVYNVHSYNVFHLSVFWIKTINVNKPRTPTDFFFNVFIKCVKNKHNFHNTANWNIGVKFCDKIQTNTKRNWAVLSICFFSVESRFLSNKPIFFCNINLRKIRNDCKCLI